MGMPYLVISYSHNFVGLFGSLLFFAKILKRSHFKSQHFMLIVESSA